jgi:hypothetical protein
MMKLSNKMKLGAFALQIETLLRDLIGHIPSVKINAVRPEVIFFNSRADLLLEADAGGQPWSLVVEWIQQGQPRTVQNGCLRLRQTIEQAREKPCYGIIAAPFLSAESVRLCDQAGIGCVDLSGNARLSFSQVYIERQSAENPFNEKRHLRSLFTAKAGRVLRVLLTPPLRVWKVVELGNAAGVSLGQVSNVRKLLLDRAWAMADDRGLRLSKPEELARAWQTVYEPRQLARTPAYTLLHDKDLDDAILTATAEAGNGAHAVLASYSAASWLAPYARQATRFFYADKPGLEILRRQLHLQPAEQGENVVVLEPREDDVFSGRVQAAPGIWCSGLVQTWLDLCAAGKRGGEAAEHLLQEKLLPAWKQGITA